MGKLNLEEPVTVVCYGEEEHWITRKAALNFYSNAIDATDGHEQQRYINIVDQLEQGSTFADDFNGDAY